MADSARRINTTPPTTLHRVEPDCLDFEVGPFTVLFGKNNAGKTNILETIFGIFAGSDERAVRRTHAERSSHPDGAMEVTLEPGLPFDDAVSAALGAEAGPTPRAVTLTRRGAHVGDPSDYVDPEAQSPGADADVSEVTDWPSLHVLFLNWEFAGLHERVATRIAELAGTQRQRLRRDWPWLEMIRTTDGEFAYRVPVATEARVNQLASLTSDLFPDFVDGTIRAHVTAASLWGIRRRCCSSTSSAG